jgi:hypothetical protein
MQSSQSNPRNVPGLLGLCIILWLAGIIFSLVGIWQLVTASGTMGGIALAMGLLSVAAATGLYRLKRWGVLLFGVLGLLGSINHLASILYNYSDLSQAGLGEVFAALFNVLVGILIPIGLIYLFLLYWKRTA